MLLAGGLFGAGWRRVELDRIQRTREATARVTVAIQEATRACAARRRGAAVGDRAPWDAAVAAAEKARDLLVVGVESGVREQVEAMIADLAAARGRAAEAAEAAARDRRLIDRLTDIRSARADDRLGDSTVAAYGDTFHVAGIDPDNLSPEEAGHRIKARPSEVASALAVTLDDWAAIRRDLLKDATGTGRLAAAARRADPDPWRNRLRDALEIADRPARRARLTDLAASAETGACRRSASTFWARPSVTPEPGPRPSRSFARASAPTRATSG